MPETVFLNEYNNTNIDTILSDFNIDDNRLRKYKLLLASKIKKDHFTYGYFLLEKNTYNTDIIELYTISTKSYTTENKKHIFNSQFNPCKTNVDFLIHLLMRHSLGKCDELGLNMFANDLKNIIDSILIKQIEKLRGNKVTVINIEE